MGKSVNDTGKGLQTHKHLHHGLLPPSESRDHGHEGKYAQMINGNTVFTVMHFSLFSSTICHHDDNHFP